MKIVSIFEVLKECLLSVQYDENVFRYIMGCWRDVEYLRNFFKKHDKDLTSGFYGEITINEAIRRTLDEAEELERNIKEIAQRGQTDKTNTLQTLFRPLKKTEENVPEHQKSKVYGTQRKSWLRIYAIRIGPNLFVISGGAIKLTPNMEPEHLMDELRKLEITKNYLKEKEIFDEDDYELLEF